MNRNPPDEERERYRELLEELRTIIPGAQVLLAFLLTVPFAARFSQVDYFWRQPHTIAYQTLETVEGGCALV